VSLAEIENQAARRQLERILASPGFARKERLSQFLSYVVEEHLAGRGDELKEALIGVEVFGRSPGYNSKQDPVVRTEASRLRARLHEYYRTDGEFDPLVIEMPKGGYVPLFRQRPERVPLAPAGGHKFPGAPVFGIVCALAALCGAAWWWLRPHTPIAIAVLPLENLSGDPADEYFADGLTDELIRNLAIIDGLAPRSQTSSFAFKGKPRNIREIGRELNVEYILEGSVLRSGEELRVDAQFIRVRDDSPVWTGKFDRELADVFAVQNEISLGIVNSLRLKLGRGQRRYETSVEAYDPYLRARAIRGALSGNDQSVRLFDEAIAKDRSFAPAYAGLAASYAYMTGTFENAKRLDNELANMRTAAERALQLDPLLAEGHAALGMAAARDGQWAQSEKSFRRAIELDPSRSESYSQFAMYLLVVLGRTEEALRLLQAAERADPLSPDVHYSLGYVLTSMSRFDEAAAECGQLPVDYRNRNECLGRARSGQGRLGEAIDLLSNTGNRGYFGYAYARAGRRDDAERVASAIAPNPFNQALVFAGLRDRERTLDALERMAALGPVRIGRALTFPEFAFVRGDPRVSSLRKRVGLPN